MRALVFTATVVIAVIGSAVQSGAKETFAEELLLRPLPGGQLLAYFSFHQSAPYQRHYDTFPNAISQLAASVPFEELELALTHGRWELRASFAPDLPEPAARAAWRELSHALGGLLCASLNFLAREETTATRAIEMGAASGPRAATRRVLYAALPKEAVCTENLTPWLKLLPCRDADGLAAALTSRPAVYSAAYHSMGIQLSVERGPTGAPLSVTLAQTLALVLRASPSSSGQRAPSTAPHSELGSLLADWDLASTLSAAPLRACAVATLSRVYVDLADAGAAQPPAVDEGGDSASSRASADTKTFGRRPGGAPPWWEAFALSPQPGAVLRLLPGPGSDNAGSAEGVALAAYALLPARQASPTHSGESHGAGASQGATAAGSLHLRQQWRRGAAAAQVTAAAARARRPRLSVHRYVTGVGQMNGAFTLHLARPETAEAAVQGVGFSGGPWDVCIFQVIPWYVKLWLHTLDLEVDGQPVPLDGHMSLRYVSLARDRERPTTLDLCLSLPPNARTATLSCAFSKAFLTVFEYPPDAHRGFDVPAAIITYPAAPPALASTAPLQQQPRSGMNASSAAAAAPAGLSEGCTQTGVLHPQPLVWSVALATSAAHLEDYRWLGANGAGTPLMRALAAQSAEEVYSEGLLVSLAPPDFSMPYNVICLTSTVMAVYMGAALNTLLRRTHGAAAPDAAAARALALRKAVKVGVALLGFAVLAVYLDDGVREALEGVLVGLGLKESPPPTASI